MKAYRYAVCVCVYTMLTASRKKKQVAEKYGTKKGRARQAGEERKKGREASARLKEFQIFCPVFVNTLKMFERDVIASASLEFTGNRTKADHEIYRREREQEKNEH